MQTSQLSAARATRDSIAFRYLAANTHLDHDTIATFRRRFLPQLEALFVQVLLLACEMKLMKLGRIALDGTKVKANASKHKVLSFSHLKKIEAPLKAEVSALTAQAQAQAEASVDTDTILVVSTHMTQATNDKQQMKPALTKLKYPTRGTGQGDRPAGRYRLF